MRSSRSPNPFATIVALAALLLAACASAPLAQTGTRAAPAAPAASWLDQALVPWNHGGAAIPKASPAGGGSPGWASSEDPRCREADRRPTLDVDRAVVAVGWRLYGAAQIYGRTTVVKARSGADGMCRPLGYQAFVFHDGLFAGTVAPAPMDARTDGCEVGLELTGEMRLTAVFARYASSDPLCCPSRSSRVIYRLERGEGGPRLVPEQVTTERTGTPAAEPTGEPTAEASGPTTSWLPETIQKGHVTGIVSFPDGAAPPAAATMEVSLRNLSQPDDPANVIALLSLPCCAERATRFDLDYDPSRIEDEDEYVVFARVIVNGELAFANRVPPRVVTRGRPKSVEIVLAEVPK